LDQSAIQGDKVHEDIKEIVGRLAQLVQPEKLDQPVQLDLPDIPDQLEQLVQLV
jgi:hypothetical protein